MGEQAESLAVRIHIAACVSATKGCGIANEESRCARAGRRRHKLPSRKCRWCATVGAVGPATVIGGIIGIIGPRRSGHAEPRCQPAYQECESKFLDHSV